MRFRNLSVAFASLALVVTSCSQNDLTGPSAPSAAETVRYSLAAALPSVRISEFHYDNAGTDTGEAIEISGPAGMDVSGWSVVLYNGSTTQRVPYNTPQVLSGLIPGTCGERGVLVITYPSNGIQNGANTVAGIDPDGIALVDNVGNVIERFAYEGSFTAQAAPAGGAAAGLTFDDIGVRQTGSEAAGTSVQRNGAGTWSLAPNTFGACNDQDVVAAPVDSVAVTPASAAVTEGATIQFTAAAFDATGAPVSGVAFTWTSSDALVATVNASGLATGIEAGSVQIIATAPNGESAHAALQVDDPAPPVTGAVRFNEIHYDNNGADVNEAIEVEGPAGLVLSGWSIVLYNGNGGGVYRTVALTGTIPSLCNGRGVVSFPITGIENGSPDGMALVNPSAQVVEFLSYEGTMTATAGPAAGLTSTDIGVAESTSAAPDRSLQRDTENSWFGPFTSSFGSCNPPPPPPTLSLTGRNSFDAALPVGFQDQLFATMRDAGNREVPTTVSWTSETPGIATVDQDGVVTSISEGTAIIRGTAADGFTTATQSLPMIVGSFGGTAQYAGNAEFGEPADADASDDFIIRRTQFTSSYNSVRNIPNWVSYNLDASHIGAQDRCDCFTYDPLVPSGVARYTTADYTGAGAIAGYGIDRGHLARSFDRTTGTLDNAGTFYFSNIIPQASRLNQGIWAQMENFLGDLARVSNKEVYIITGASGSRGSVKNLGMITIPATVWKVAVIMPRDQGLVNVASHENLEVIAVIMPNDSVLNSDWQSYKTTVDAVEQHSGYDLLALLSDPVEIAVESGTEPPTAAVDGPYSVSEGSAAAMSAAGSTDPDSDALTYDWTFGDGASGTGASQSHIYSQDGSYTVRLIATDIRGLSDTVTTTATVSNVAPLIGAFASATLFPGETYSASGTFIDPGSDTWSSTVNFGAGGGVTTLPLVGKTFTLSNTYNAAGLFTITVTVADDDATSAATQTVTVLSTVQGLQNAIVIVNDLAARGKLSSRDATHMRQRLEQAIEKIQKKEAKGKEKVPSEIKNFLKQLDDLVRDGDLAAADAEPLKSLVTRVRDSLER